MELIEGGSLARRVEAGAMSLSDALRVCGDIARGLLAAHSAGVIHRDLKPDNVMLAGASADGPLTGQERVVITDFGIARAAEEQAGSDERATAHRGAALTVGGLIGTPAYMAPEQLMGETPDGRTDVYALGGAVRAADRAAALRRRQPGRDRHGQAQAAAARRARALAGLAGGGGRPPALDAGDRPPRATGRRAGVGHDREAARGSRAAARRPICSRVSGWRGRQGRRRCCSTRRARRSCAPSRCCRSAAPTRRSGRWRISSRRPSRTRWRGSGRSKWFRQRSPARTWPR
ncbi:protein kinase [Nannocystis sp.]|uniref:protein kinase domain-containing protein n=1 Tax=Nannocystis sp. TaxID=1962667 RepID=UPI00344B93A5|nr:protein kinase [Nannocystis sp.]